MPTGSACAPSVTPDSAQPDLAGLIAAALGRPVSPDERLAVAVSGGPDSLALLTLAVAAFPGRVTALTVDHALRAGSAAEAAGVAAQCAARGIAHALLVHEGPAFTANVQAQARAARYRLLAEWCVGHGVGLLLTAHHADDQAETLLMRLNRSSGSGGLAGIRASRPLAPHLMLVRPLLGLRKAELAAIAAAAGWQAVADPANRDPRHDRTTIRALLAATPVLDVAALAASAGHLAAEAEALDWAAARAWDGRVTFEEQSLNIDAFGLPAALVQRLLARGIAQLAGQPARGSDIARLAARLGAGKAATVAGVMVRPGPVWRLSLAPPRSKARQSGHKTG
jgi:tRNA(Ile)-lysidine synthase